MNQLIIIFALLHLIPNDVNQLNVIMVEEGTSAMVRQEGNRWRWHGDEPGKRSMESTVHVQDNILVVHNVGSDQVKIIPDDGWALTKNVNWEKLSELRHPATKTQIHIKRSPIGIVFSVSEDGIDQTNETVIVTWNTNRSHKSSHNK